MTGCEDYFDLAWFDHQQESSFSFRRVHIIQTVCLAVKSSCLSAENIQFDKTPLSCHFTCMSLMILMVDFINTKCVLG